MNDEQSHGKKRGAHWKAMVHQDRLATSERNQYKSKKRYFTRKSRDQGIASKQRAKSNFKIKIIEYLSHNHTTVKYFNTWKGVARDQKEANAIENNHITK